MATRKRIWYRLSCRILLLVFIVVTYDLCSITASEDRPLDGHLEPFGNHRPPDVVTEERSTVPNPAEFWKSYVAKRMPVVFRGAATRSGAYELWTEEYLISNYGDLIVRLEARSESNDRLPFGETGVLGRDTIRHFIQNYHTMDAYVISQIPQPMEKDISIPPCLRCGSFNESIQEVHLFLTAGGGQTKLHKDPYSNIHCVFNGTKDWILVHPDQTNLVYMSEDSEFEWGGFSVIDVDSVDLERFPKITDVHYSKVTMNKGDCIFMPGGYWHQVRSKGHLNSAVSIWFSQLRQFTGDGCEIMNVDFTPMDQVLILWRYSGYGDLSQGHMDIHILKRLLLTSADGEGKVWLREFALKFFKSESGFKTSLLREDETKRAHKMTEYLDPTGRGYITQEEVKSFSLEQLKELVLFVDPSDVSNTEDFEYSHINGDDIRRLLRVCENEKGNFDKDTFIASYVKFLGGTPNKALEITENLGIQDEELSMTDVLNRAPKALHKFYSSKIHDPTFERKMFQHLRVHDEL